MLLKVLLLLNLLALNLTAVYLYFKPAPLPPTPICQTVCPSPTSPRRSPDEGGPTPTPLSVSSPQIYTKKSTQVTYIPVPGNGSQLSYDWYTLTTTDFYFDTNDFPGLRAIYFEANIRLLNGNGTVFVRLFDTTHNFIVQNSQIQTNNQISTAVISPPLTFHPGRSLVKVQVKSLTADTAIFDSGRLKLVSEY